jgi:DNA-directed RNA polymerase alpha subunit
MEKNNSLPVKLAAPALRALANAKITTLQQLAEYSEKEIAVLHGIGNNALLKLKEALTENKLAFKNTANNQHN